MSKNQHEPTAWSEFTRSLDDSRTAATEAAFAFGTRWRFASSFEGIDASGYKTQGVVDGYHALLRLLLVCTAWEQLAGLLKKNKYKIPVAEAGLVADVRSALCPDAGAPFASSLLKFDGGGIGSEFISGETDNLVKLAFAVRNGVAHGSITPSGSGVKRPQEIALVNRISEAMLAESDLLFSAWVEKWVAAQQR